MFKVIATASFLKDGSETKPPMVYTWDGIEKKHVVEELEDSMIKALGKMNQMAVDVGKGKTPKPGTTNPVEMHLDIVVLEEGKKWARSLFEWPNMGEEQQAMTIGIFDGELAHVSKHVQTQQHKRGKL